MLLLQNKHAAGKLKLLAQHGTIAPSRKLSLLWRLCSVVWAHPRLAGWWLRCMAGAATVVAQVQSRSNLAAKLDCNCRECQVLTKLCSMHAVCQVMLTADMSLCAC
jgi:hypothetical protein